MRRNLAGMARVCTVALALAGAAGMMGLVGGCSSQHSGGSMTDSKLYDRLGGGAGLHKVVHAFLDKVSKDDRINKRFANTDLASLENKIVDQLGEATGGPQVYTGKDMKAAHEGMNIPEAEWDAFMEDLKSTLDDAKVAALDQQELVGILVPMKRDVVHQ